MGYRSCSENTRLLPIYLMLPKISLFSISKQLQKTPADSKEELNKLKQEQKVLRHHMFVEVKDLVPVLRTYDAKLGLSIGEVIKRNEACLKKLMATDNAEEDAELIDLLKLLLKLLNDKKLQGLLQNTAFKSLPELKNSSYSSSYLPC